MRNVLVLGGAGYIGSHICKMLHREGLKPIVVDNLCTGHIEFVKWGPHLDIDIKDTEKLVAGLAPVDFDAVIHLAAHIEVGESVKNPEKYFRNNVGGTESLLSALEELKKNVPFVFSSTAAVYGQPEMDLIPESAPLNPINPYGESKKQAEEKIAEWGARNEAPVCLLRYFNVAGADPDGEVGEAHEPETHLVPRLLLSLLDPKHEFKLFGDDYPTPDGTCIRDYVHVWDLAQAHLCALAFLRKAKGPTRINVGYSKGFSVKEIISAAERACGKVVRYETVKRRDGDPAILVADGSKAVSELGWKPKFKDSLDEIILHAWNWHRKKS